MDDEDEGEGGGAPAWMATFADLMSLLLTFFVLLLSFAHMDVMKFQGMVGSMKEAFGVQLRSAGFHVGLTDSIVTLFDRERSNADQVSPDEQLAAKLRKLVERSHLAGTVEVTTGKDGVTMRVSGDLLFEPGFVEVHPRAFIFLDEMGEVLAQLDHNVTVEGHTDDSAPSASGELSTNWHISVLRAANTVDYLASTGKVSSERLAAKGYGAGRPIAPNTTAKGRSKNRRVEFFFQVGQRQPRPRSR